MLIMKKILIMAVAAMMATVGAKAQHKEGETTFQPRVGITMSDVTNMEDSKMKVNVTYGVDFEYFATDQLSIGAGVLFTDQGATIEDDIDGKYKMNVYYTAFPITANYYVLPGLAIKAGVQPAYRVKARMEHDGQRIDMDRAFDLLLEDDDVKINKFDLAIPVGLSYEYNGLTLDARYNFGITKLFSNFEDDVRHKCVVITLGYKF